MKYELWKFTEKNGATDLLLVIDGQVVSRWAKWPKSHNKIGADSDLSAWDNQAEAGHDLRKYQGLFDGWSLSVIAGKVRAELLVSHEGEEDEHTPGPWHWGDGYYGLYGQGEGRKREVLTFEAYENMWLAYTDHRQANARLIAAAPDLLRACRELLKEAEVLEAYQGVDQSAATQARVALARQAIKKATRK